MFGGIARTHVDGSHFNNDVYILDMRNWVSIESNKSILTT